MTYPKKKTAGQYENRSNMKGQILKLKGSKWKQPKL